MRYSIVDISKAEKHSLDRRLHRCKGDRMVVNENELRHVDDDVHKAAALLGGRLMTQGEVINELNNNSHE